MTTTYVDTITDLACKEEDGAIRWLKREFLVAGLTDGDSGILGTALGSTAIPSYGDAATDYPNLIAVRRNAAILHKDKVRVEVEYEAKGDSHSAFWWRGSGTLRQKQSQVDGTGAAVTVSHTFPSDDPDYGGQGAQTQGGDVTVSVPGYELTARGVVSRYVPEALAMAWETTVNLYYWRGGPPRTWCCVNVEHEPHDMGTTPPKWMFTFSFQYDPDGWDPVAAYVDPRTGRPPANLIEGVGIKRVEWHRAIDFGILFPPGDWFTMTV